ncbi:MAG: hypothetical protein QOD03_1755, partial [Verrucomicrobiota bacterium]
FNSSPLKRFLANNQLMNCCSMVSWPRVFSVFGICFICLSTASAESASGQLYVKSIEGRAAFSADQGNWFPLEAGMVLGKGALLRTEAGSSADVILKASGTALRLVPNTLLEVAKLEKEIAGEEIITETRLNLKSGGLIGSQRKLNKLSTFAITIPGGTVSIRGTEYRVQADGAVSCLTGEVWVDYDSTKGGGLVKLGVPAGFSFDPATKHLAAIQSALLANPGPDFSAVRQNEQSFKKDTAPTVMKLAQKISPTHGDNGVGNGQDPAPPGNPPPNDGPGTGPGNPGNKGHGK